MRQKASSSSRPTVGQILAPDDRRCHRGRAFLASGEPRARTTPQPHASSPGSRRLCRPRLLGCSQSCIFGECFTLGNRPGILKESHHPACKGLIQLLQKRSSQEEREQGGSSPSAPRAGILQQQLRYLPVGPRWMVRSPQPSSRESKKQELEMDRWGHLLP